MKTSLLPKTERRKKRIEEKSNREKLFRRGVPEENR